MKSLHFYKDLFISESITKSKEELIDAIINQHTFLHTYIVTMPLVESENQLEIYHIELNKQSYFHPENFIVIGIALGYVDALELVEKITHLVYTESKDANIKAYFQNKL